MKSKLEEGGAPLRLRNVINKDNESFTNKKKARA